MTSAPPAHVAEMDPALYGLLREGDPEDEVAVLLRLHDPAHVPAGVRIVARLGPVVTARVPRGELRRVRADPAVASLKAPRLYTPDLEPTGEAESGPLPGDHPFAPVPGCTGRGVVVGFVDWGGDFAHPDFRHPDGTTRLLALWDQRGGPSAGRTPDPYGYGRVYSAAEIDAALTQTDPYAALGYHPADADGGLGAHGTHTLGIACGNGRAGGPMGLAPDARPVFVHAGSREGTGAGPLGNSAELLEGVDFIARLAGSLGLDWVVNLSLGRHAGEHTGRSLVERGLDALVAGGPGRAVVQSCGNYFGRRAHASWQVWPGVPVTVRLEVDPADTTDNELDLWYPGADRLRVTLAPDLPEGEAQEISADPGERRELRLGGGVVARLAHRAGDPNNGDHQCGVRFAPGGRVRTWTLTLTPLDVVDGRVHAWLERDGGCRVCQVRFTPEAADPRTTLGTICNGTRTLAVGALDAHAPEFRLGRFSSSGPTRDGRQKPDLLAPGVMVLAPRSAPRGGGANPYTRMSGTSMAAPAVTATVALMFEAARRALGRPLEAHETRAALLAACTPPPPGADPHRCGAGVLDPGAAVARVLALGKAEAQEDTDMTAADTETAPIPTDLPERTERRGPARGYGRPFVRASDLALLTLAGLTLARSSSPTAPNVTVTVNSPEPPASAAPPAPFPPTEIPPAEPAPEGLPDAQESSPPCPPGPVPASDRPALLRRGSRHPAVGDAQRRLNTFSLGEVALGHPALPETPLALDCIFGPRTEAAVLAFQRRVFSDPREHDGLIGPHTWAQLDRVEAGAATLAFMTDDFGAEVGWNDVLGLETASVNLQLTLRGGHPAQRPDTVTAEFRSRPPGGVSGPATLGTPVTRTLSPVGPAAPDRAEYRLSVPLPELGDFLRVERTHKEVASVVRVGGTSDAEFRGALGWISRGQATQPETAAGRTGDEAAERPDARALMRAAGVEVLEVRVTGAGLPALPPARRLARSPADLVYYSGHGLRARNCLAVETAPHAYDCWMRPADLAAVWRRPMDLDLLVLAGCSVLGVDFAPFSAPGGPGLAWAALLTSRGGPLAALMGYGGSAPLDDPVGNRIAREFGARLTAGLSGPARIARAWLEINLDHRAHNAVALTNEGYWDISLGLTGHGVRGPRALE